MATMTSDDFVRLIVDHFGKGYKSRGISDVIKVDLRGVPSENLTRLLKEVKRHYKASYGLPELPDILKIAKETEIDLRPNRNEKITTMWKCGQCGKIYEYEKTNCSNRDCGKKTSALPVICPCGTYYPDSFVCCTKEENKKKIDVRIYDLRNDEREQSVRCEVCGKVWTYFEKNSKPHIVSVCVNENCRRPRETGRVVKGG